ncbi:MAG TPA: HD domain-containing protein [Spirochaetota bacterium]|nr:HD domain-containing protein [Spirochaetota bacterium]HPS87356.1 HD domain-containing protein [Spirochaetota bacterium]
MVKNFGKKRVVIDLDYIMPDTAFVYPIYSSEGEKLLNEREILTAQKIKLIREKCGNKVYYSLPENEAGLMPDYVYNRAFNKTKEIMDAVLHTDKFTIDGYKKSEELVIEILDELNSKEISAINLLKDIKNFDEYLYYHSINVGMLTAIMVKKRRKFKKEEVRNIVLGAYLCDLGKVKLEKTVLDKPDKLNDDELMQMHLHPQIGYNIVKSLEDINPIVLQTILFHHEQFDDEGYYSLPYDSLPSSPKIVSICDMYDALTSPRPFRQPYSPSEAMKIILNSTDKKFDRELVSDFLNGVGSLLNNSQYFYRKGDFSILNTNEVALINDISKLDIMKPKVMVFARYDYSGEKATIRFYENPIEVDLAKDMHRKLDSIIMHQKLIDAIRKRLVEKKTLIDYLYVALPEK